MKETPDPIFILSVGPRTGSTWLQRAMTSTGKVLIWGESDIISHFFGIYWSREGVVHTLSDFRKKKADMWMAMLNPSRGLAIWSFRRFLENTYGRQAYEMGFGRWGMKETRWSGISVEAIEEMWPESRIVFLVREFGASYRSRFPEGTGFVPQNFDRRTDICLHCKQWIDQAEVMFNLKPRPTRRLVRYEDLLVESEMDSLLEWLGLGKPDLTQFSRPISQSANKFVFLPQEDIPIFAPFRVKVEELTLKMGYPRLTI